MGIEKSFLTDEQIQKGITSAAKFVDRLKDCEKKGHLNSEVLGYGTYMQRLEAYCFCNDCQTTYSRPMTEKERDKYLNNLRTPIDR